MGGQKAVIGVKKLSDNYGKGLRIAAGDAFT